MKISIRKILLISSIIISTVYAGAYLDYFHARSDADNVTLEWRTQIEANVKNFVIERKTVQSSYAEIETIQPVGNYHTYYYTDKSAYKAQDVIFVYRVKIVDNDGKNSYSIEASVSPTISGVKRTWGSIKAMFR